MLERIGRSIPALEVFMEQRRLQGFARHQEPTSANFFWLMHYVHKSKMSIHLIDQGYDFTARRYEQKWTSTDGAPVSSNSAVKVTLVHPTRVEHLGISSIFGWENRYDSKHRISVHTCVVDVRKPEGTRRVGDLSVDEIVMPARGSQDLSINHLFLDGNDDQLGLETGVLTPRPEAVSRSAYYAMFYFLRDGSLPPRQVMPQLSDVG